MAPPLSLSIGSGSAYANDRLAPAAAMADSGRVTYLGFDCLAERTMALAHVRRRDAARHVLPGRASRMSECGGKTAQARSSGL